MDVDDGDDENDADFATENGGKGQGNDGGSSCGDSSGEDAVEDENARRVRLLVGVVRTNEDYGLGDLVRIPDANAAAPAVFEGVELTAPMFFASRSVVRAGGFTEVDPPICFQCLRWNLTAPFSLCNRDGWTGCGRCSFIQHAKCKDVGDPDPSRTSSVC